MWYATIIVDKADWESPGFQERQALVCVEEIMVKVGPVWFKGMTVEKVHGLFPRYQVQYSYEPRHLERNKSPLVGRAFGIDFVNVHEAGELAEYDPGVAGA